MARVSSGSRHDEISELTTRVSSVEETTAQNKRDIMELLPKTAVTQVKEELAELRADMTIKFADIDPIFG